jgi:hypothetical protein
MTFRYQSAAMDVNRSRPLTKSPRRLPRIGGCAKGIDEMKKSAFVDKLFGEASNRALQ